jgi:hypothetical protein
MGQLISQFQEEATERVFGDYAFEEEGFFHPRHHNWLPEQTKEAKRNYEEYNNYSSVTATVFVVVMIILLMVLLICCIKTVMVCRRQKRVNDQRRRIMQRQAESHHHSFEPRAYTIHQAYLPGGGIPQVFMPEDIYRCDEPPAYDQVIGLPPSYDSVIILNGVQSRGASVVGSVRNSVMGTVRSLRRGSRSAIQCGAPCQTDSVISASPPSEIGSTKSESLIASVSNQMVTGRYPMSEPEESQIEQSQRSRSTKSLRRNKSTFSLSKVKSEAEDEESLTAE